MVRCLRHGEPLRPERGERVCRKGGAKGRADRTHQGRGIYCPNERPRQSAWPNSYSQATANCTEVHLHAHSSKSLSPKRTGGLVHNMPDPAQPRDYNPLVVVVGETELTPPCDRAVSAVHVPVLPRPIVSNQFLAPVEEISSSPA